MNPSKSRLAILLAALIAMTASAAEKPNFLFILTDDQAPHTLGAYGNTVCRTPPVLEGKIDRIRDLLYGVYCGGSKPGIRSVKTGHWKLIKYDVLDGRVQETQLFNLVENPDELLGEHHDTKVIALTGNIPKPHQVNLADDPGHAAKRKELEALLLAEQVRLGDPYRLWDQPKDPAKN